MDIDLNSDVKGWVLFCGWVAIIGIVVSFIAVIYGL